MSDASPRKKPIPHPIARGITRGEGGERRGLAPSRVRSILPSVAFLAAALAAAPLLVACGHHDDVSIVAERHVRGKADPQVKASSTGEELPVVSSVTTVTSTPIGGNPDMIEVTTTPTGTTTPFVKPKPKPPIVPTTVPPPMPGGIGMVKPPPPMPMPPKMAGGAKPASPTI